MNRLSRSGQRRLAVQRGSHRVVSATLVTLLIAMLASAAVVAPAPFAARAQAATPVTVAVTPESALLYVAVNLDTTSAQHQKATELLQRLGIDSPLEDLAGQVSTTVTGEDVTAGMPLDALLGGETGIAVFSFGSDLTALTGSLGGDLGEMGIATPSPGGDGVTATSAAIILSAPDPDAAYAAAEAQLQQDATDQGATVSEETYEGVQIKTVPADEAMGTTGSALARVGDFVVLGQSAADVKLVIDTEAGRTPSLAASADFAAASAELNAEWLALGFVNGTEVAAQLTAGAESSGMDISTLDLAQFKANTGFVVWADDPGFRLDSITLPVVGGEPPAANFDPQLPQRIPGEALFFFDGTELGKSGILDSIFLSVLSSLTGSVGGDIATPDPSKSPQEIAQEQFAQLELLLGFNVKTDFIDQMVGEWGVAVWGIDAAAISGQDTSGIRALIVSDTLTPAVVSDAASKLSLLLQAGLAGQGTVTTRLVGEDTVQVLTVDDGSGTGPITIEYGVVAGQFIISVNDAISSYVAGVDVALADNPSYRAALAALPAEHNAIFYLDLTQLVAIYEATMASLSSGFEFADASEKCAEYSTQAAAQEAFDADPATNWELDQDFDGQACEDFFNPTTPEPAASPAASQYAALKAFATVAYERGGMSGTSSLLLIVG
jgi:hypothetical protein